METGMERTLVCLFSKMVGVRGFGHFVEKNALRIFLLRRLSSTEKGSASLAFFCFALLLSRAQYRSDSNPNISKLKKPTLGELF
jgi:hypothetical protein